MPGELTYDEKRALAMRMWLSSHGIEPDILEHLFTPDTAPCLVKLVDDSDPLTRVVVAALVFAMTRSGLFEDFIVLQYCMPASARAEGFI